MFCEIKNPFTTSPDRPYLFFGSPEEIMIASVDAICKTCVSRGVAMEADLAEALYPVDVPHRPSRPRKYCKEKKYLRDNTPEYKRLCKSRKANRELARERREEQYFTLRDPEHGNKDVIPYYPVWKNYRSRKANERFAEALRDLVTE